MTGRDSTQSLLVLRKLTRAITDAVRVQMTEYLSTLTPLFRPSVVLGDYIKGAQKEPTRKTEKAFKELQTLYEAVATAKPYNLPRELDVTVQFLHHHARDHAARLRTRRTIGIGYPDHHGASPSDVGADLHRVCAVAAAGAPRYEVEVDRGTAEVRPQLPHPARRDDEPAWRPPDPQRAALPRHDGKLAEFGELPITRISVDISTERPSDAIVLETAGLTGMDAFEEVVNVGELSRLPDGLKERLLEIVRQQAPELVSR